MQSQNSNSRKKVVITLLVIAVLVVVTAIAIVTKKQGEDELGEYYDPGSGETVSNPKNREPEKYGTIGPDITLLGTTRLLDIGVTKYQIDGLRSALLSYSDRREGRPISEASVNTSTIKSEILNNAEADRIVRFELTINRTEKYDAELSLIGIKSARLRLIQRGNSIFKSELMGSTDDSYTGDGVPPEEQPN